MRLRLSLFFLALGSCARTESPEAVRLPIHEDHPVWFSYMLHDAPPNGTGWIFTTAKHCGDRESFRKSGLSILTSGLEPGEYDLARELHPRDYFSERKRSSIWIADDLNPFSIKEGSFKIERGKVTIVPNWTSKPNEGPGLKRSGSVRVFFSGMIDPSKFRPDECSSKESNDKPHSIVQCDCKNPRGDSEKCKIELEGKDAESAEMYRICCEQLNSNNPDYVRVEGSFEAKYCNDFCATSDPGLLKLGCPPIE